MAAVPVSLGEQTACLPYFLQEAPGQWPDLQESGQGEYPDASRGPSIPSRRTAAHGNAAAAEGAVHDLRRQIDNDVRLPLWM